MQTPGVMGLPVAWEVGTIDFMVWIQPDLDLLAFVLLDGEHLILQFHCLVYLWVSDYISVYTFHSPR